MARIEDIVGTAGSYGSWLSLIDAAPNQEALWVKLAARANQAQRDSTNFRKQLLQVKDTVHF